MTPQEKLKILRKERKLTTEELGKRCGMLQSTISKLENGKRKMNLETLNVLAKALNVSVNEFFEDNQLALHQEETLRTQEEIFQKGIKDKAEDELKEIQEDKTKEQDEDEADVTNELNMLMQKFYSNEGGPLFFNGVALDGDALEELEESLKFAIRGLKQKNKRRRQQEANK